MVPAVVVFFVIATVPTVIVFIVVSTVPAVIVIVVVVEGRHDLSAHRSSG